VCEGGGGRGRTRRGTRRRRGVGTNSKSGRWSIKPQDDKDAQKT